MSVLFHFTLILLKLEHALITADLIKTRQRRSCYCTENCFSQVLKTIIADNYDENI